MAVYRFEKPAERQRWLKSPLALNPLFCASIVCGTPFAVEPARATIEDAKSYTGLAGPALLEGVSNFVERGWMNQR